jgi:hypothetical protein
MSSPVEFLRGLLAKHFEELEFLLARRAIALQSSAYRLENLHDLEERIEAHVDGLILGGQEALPLLSGAIGGDEPGPVSAAALVLLRLDQPSAAGLVIEALQSSPPPKALAIGWALCHGPTDKVTADLQKIASSGDPAPAAAAAEALAYRKNLKVDESRLAALSGSDDPGVRAATWRIAALL